MSYYGIEILSTEEEMKKALISMVLTNLPTLPTNADIHQYIIDSLAFLGIKARKETAVSSMPKCYGGTIPLGASNNTFLVNCDENKKLYAKSDDEEFGWIQKEGE